MSTVSTFSGFTMARLGIMASSKAMEVTGNNISNINTPGYTRQSLDQRALFVGGADVYSSQFDVRVGAGALTTGVSQLRDPYLDIRFRNENAKVGFYEGKYDILQSLSLIMNEVAKGEEDGGVMEKQFNDILEQLQVMNTEHAGDKSYDSAVRKSAEALVQLFHTYSESIDKVLTNTQAEFKENIGEVNRLLTKLRELNESIKKAEISSGALSDAERKEGMIGERGQQALELRDERNTIIDELSKLIPIDVKYSDESIGAGMTVEKLTITLKGNSDAVLVDGVYRGQLSVQEDPKNAGNEDPYLRLQISVLENGLGQKMAVNKPGGEVYKIKDQELKSGTLQAQREMLTKVGEYSSTDEIAMDPNASTKRGIRYYQNALDALAQKFASIFNEANMKDKDGFWLVDENGNGVEFDFNAIPNPTPEVIAEIKNYKPTADGKPLINGAGALFSNNGDGNDPSGITAGNISISYNWSHETTHVIQTRDPAKNHLSTANDNIAHLIAQMQADHAYAPGDIQGTNHNPVQGSQAANTDAFYTGSFQGMLTYVNNMLGNDQKATGDILDNFYASSQELDLGRESVSGVDLNDEAVNMMQLQKSYSASCRLLTTIDELLDKLINGTGVAGR